MFTGEAPASDGGSDITGYKVQWKESADSWDTPADVSEAPASGTIRTITGLTDGVEYSVRVLATNGVGDSPPSVEQTGTPRGDQGAGNGKTQGGRSDPESIVRRGPGRGVCAADGFLRCAGGLHVR